METSTLKYFLHVAKLENIHQASKIAHVSPSTLSKALAKLEDELGVKLFERNGRNIRLTQEGRFLQERATQIVDIEEATRAKLLGVEEAVNLSLCGQEILLALKGVELGLKMRRTFEQSSLEFMPVDSDEQSFEAVRLGNAQIAIATKKPTADLFYVDIGDIEFSLFVGSPHPLYASACQGVKHKVEEVLRHPFASLIDQRKPELMSTDGWRDDQFPREFRFISRSLNTLEKLLSSGQAIAYLPDSFATKLNLTRVLLADYPFSTSKRLRLVTRDPSRFDWLH